MEIPMLTSGESKVYQALTELGESAIGTLIKTAGVSHSKVYDILKRLAKKGLVSTINRGGKQYFSAAPPTRLQELIADEKEQLAEAEEDMKRIIKQLELRRDSAQSESLLHAYEGMKGMKTVLEMVLDHLKEDKEVLIMGTPKDMVASMGGYLKEWQRQRIAKKVLCKLIADVDAESWKDEFWINSKEQGLTITKRSQSISPAYVIITPRSVATIYFSAAILSFLVTHDDIANRYRAFFEQAWENNG
ncbi:hypothetical protein GF342_01330 [Candidatus Woesearchaeota archaeon]|nr:hypothetical protein [Candidatus Woesearchaeota archaeon]